MRAPIEPLHSVETRLNHPPPPFIKRKDDPDNNFTQFLRYINLIEAGRASLYMIILVITILIDANFPETTFTNILESLIRNSAASTKIMNSEKKRLKKSTVGKLYGITASI